MLFIINIMSEKKPIILSDLQEEVRDLRVDIAQAEASQKPALVEKLIKTVKEKVRVSRDLEDFRRRMHEAAEAAEKSGVGTGGKGSLDD